VNAIYYPKRRYEVLNKVEILLPSAVAYATGSRGEGRTKVVRWRTIISRDALSVSLEQFPLAQPVEGIGDTAEPFSNIKTPVTAMIRRSTRKIQISQKALKKSRARANLIGKIYRPRYLAHLVLLGAASVLVLSSSSAGTHTVSLRLMTSSQAGLGSSLDDAAIASITADIAKTSGLMIADTASETATSKNKQVALLTTDDDTLAKRQVVSTAGNPTRDVTTYTVQPGDTLSGIASQFNITSQTVEWANNLSDSDMVKPGQVLTILPVSGLLYTVAQGDTAGSLANTYQANAAQILSFNNAQGKGLTPGVQIIIPGGVEAQAAAPAQTPTPVLASISVPSATTSYPQLTHFPYSGNGYSFGYCTYYVASRRNIPSNWGNANQWYYNAQASGFSVGSVPVPGAVAWTGAGYYGHVAYVESVSGNMVTVSEMNYNGNWDRVTERTVPSSEFSYIY
jgi:surface antigen